LESKTGPDLNIRRGKIRGKRKLEEEQRMDIAGPVGRAVLGIRLLPSWASRATDGLPCVVLFLAIPQPKPVPSRRLACHKPCLSKTASSLYLHSFVFFGIARPLNPRSRTTPVPHASQPLAESCFMPDSSAQARSYPPQPPLKNTPQCASVSPQNCTVDR
jgi:hypothetical protein